MNMFNFTKNINSVIKNKELQRQLEEEGYVIVPFYTKDEIQALTRFYNENTSSQQQGFQPTTYFNSLEYRLKASEFIKQIALNHLDEYLENFKVYMGSFIVKHADKNSELGVHQDMTLVDESKFMGINIWSPLCDTTPENGALYLIPKSHRIFPTYRNATISNIYDKHYSLIKKYMQPVYMKAGEAILFDHSILHYSPPNLSKEVRIATNIFITHKDSVITICYHDKEKNRIELFEEKDDFFTTYRQFDNQSNKLRPQIGKSIGFRDYDFPQITPQKMKALYGVVPNQSVFEKIKSIFNR